MKKSRIFQIFSLYLFLVILSTNLFSQPSKEIIEGKEYWFGIPYCKLLQQEAIRGEVPIALWISSKVNTQATITDIETGMNKTVNVVAHKITQVTLSDNLMNRESEVIKNYGINVKSKDPISVAVYLSYRWSGEAYRVIPVEWLGKKYYTANLYQDETDEKKPAQILVIATQDGTILKYRPTTSTPKISSGQIGSVTLNKGQTFLILAKTQDGFTQDWSTDLSGTYIDASKPVAVLSGHTKGAFPRFFIGQRSGWMEVYANFSRNMIIDMIWPMELWGNEYVSAPIKYNDRPRGIFQDDKGDLIRFVAGYDGTEIYQMRQDGSSLMKISKTLRKGEWHNITNQEDAAYYWANKPFLAVQYGKTWWSDIGMMGGTDKKQPDDPMNPHRCGQGMMVVLAPVNHWCGYASFRSPEAMDDFVYLTFKDKDKGKIKFDDTYIVSKWGTSIKPINGTEYSYITETVAPGDHYVEGVDSARFAGYAYGNWDRMKDGFAYGYPIGINYTIPCDDSLYVKETIQCGNVTGQGFAIPDTAECSGIFTAMMDVDSSYNYIFDLDSKFSNGDKVVNFTVKVIDESKPAKAVVSVITRSGKIVTKIYEYIPEEIAADPNKIDFGLMKVGQKICKTFTIKNPGTSRLTVKNLRLKSGKAEFSITLTNVLPFTLEPGETKDIEVCATALKNQNFAVTDSIIADLSCFSKPVVFLTMTTGEPIVYITDQNWGQVPVGNEVGKSVQIINKGTVKVELYSMDWPDKKHFTKVEGINFPLSLDPGESYNFTAFYQPDTYGVQDSTRADFEGNTKVEKVYSDWIGIGTQPGPEIEGYDWKERRVISKWTPPNYEWKVILKNLVGDADVKVTDVIIEEDPDGVFSLDRASIPSVLQKQTSFDLKAYFAPKDEKTYMAKVVLICSWNGSEIRKFDYLVGKGIQPHITAEGIDYGPAILVGSYKDSTALVSHVTNVNPMEVTLSKISIAGADKDAFVIDPAWYSNSTNWEKIAVGGSINVPIRFTATHAGDHNAEMIVESDAPESPIAGLIGRGYLVGINASDHDHGIIFVTQNNSGRVFLTNTGTNPATINQPINLSLSTVSGDAGTFSITGWKTVKSGLNNPPTPFDLNAGDTLFVDVKFNPNTDKKIVANDPQETRSYQARIDYKTSSGNAISTLTGKATVMRFIAKIPSGTYKANPGSQVEVSILVNKHPQENKPVSQAKIQEFTAEVKFKSTGRENVQDVFPAQKIITDGSAFGCKDIIKEGTVTQSWTCIKADTSANGTTLRVYMTGNSDLDLPNAENTLFKVKFNTYLSDLDLIRLPIFIKVDPVADGYTLIDTIPGNIKINPVCVNTLRLIKLSGIEYNLSNAVPNPADNQTLVNYSVALEAYTSLTLYNNSGDKVATFVEEILRPGDYQLNINVRELNLSSGAYQLRMQSGPYSQSRTLIITK